jgi:hypothetical protein
MTSDEVRKRLLEDPDFVYLPRFENSVLKLLERYPDGVPPKIIAQGLMMTEDEVVALYERVVTKLRRYMGVNRG